jgi:hypothetical protein
MQCPMLKVHFLDVANGLIISRDVDGASAPLLRAIHCWPYHEFTHSVEILSSLLHVDPSVVLRHPLLQFVVESK